MFIKHTNLATLFLPIAQIPCSLLFICDAGAVSSLSILFDAYNGAQREKINNLKKASGFWESHALNRLVWFTPS